KSSVATSCPQGSCFKHIEVGRMRGRPLKAGSDSKVVTCRPGQFACQSADDRLGWRWRMRSGQTHPNPPVCADYSEWHPIDIFYRSGMPIRQKRDPDLSRLVG